MIIINQREIYLENLKRKTKKFWIKVLEDYNNKMPVTEIAKKYTNPKTGKHYSRGHIHAIIKEMRQSGY